MGITCGGDADGDSHDGDFELSASVFAVDAGDADRAQEVLDHVGFGALEIEPADVPGGELASTCIDDAENSLSMCVSFWTADGFVLGVDLASDVRAIPDGAASAALADLFADIAATLGELADLPPAATDVVLDSTPPGTLPVSAGGGRLDFPAPAPDWPRWLTTRRIRVRTSHWPSARWLNGPS